METQDLIRRLTADGTAVRRLPSPWSRAALWLAISLPYVAAVVLLVHAPDDVAGLLADRQLLFEQVATLATAVTAAFAAFWSVVPGRDDRVLLLPLAPLVLWLGSLGEGCVQDWFRLGAAGLQLRPDWECLLPAVAISSIPALAMVLMLRRGAPLFPRASVLLGALAVAAIGNFGLRLFHPGDVTIMMLVWHFGCAMVLSLLAGLAGRHVLSWSRLSGPRHDFGPSQT